MSTPVVHPFERAGLGKAPFRCVGMYESKYQAIPGDPSCPIQPGSMCDYCANGIMNVFRIKSADGKEFKVGCDCVARTSDACAKTDAERVARELRTQVNRLKTAAANARKDERIAAALARFEANAERLKAMTVSRMGMGGASYERCAYEYLQWMFTHSGRTGKIKAAKQMDELLAQAERHRAAVNEDIIRHERDGRFTEQGA